MFQPFYAVECRAGWIEPTSDYRLRCHSKILPHIMSQNGLFQPRPPTYYFEMGTSVACNSFQPWHTEEPKKWENDYWSTELCSFPVIILPFFWGSMQCLTGQQRVGCSAEGARVTHIQVSEETTQVKGMAALRLFRPVHRAEANRTRIWHLEDTIKPFLPKTRVQHCLRQSSPGGQVLSTIASPSLVHQKVQFGHTESIGLGQRRLSLWQPLAP
ncbi:hypothetical protein TNCV_4411071 [Trichonephila clavipes]|nr:hypothetical protein TNCV_4411071 [Trichonephila clavipes]